jgi:hypothetical protein
LCSNLSVDDVRTRFAHITADDADDGSGVAGSGASVAKGAWQVQRSTSVDSRLDGDTGRNGASSASLPTVK